MNTFSEASLGNLETLYSSERTLVRTAADQDTGQSLLIKQSASLDKDYSRYGVCREWTLTRNLDERYVCRAMGQQILDHRPSLIFKDEKLQSLSLSLPKNGLDFDDWLTVAINMSRCLESIHQAGLNHRDVNPSNIVSNSDFSILKLVDFEHASILQEQALEFSAGAELQGTLAYISPEQTGRVNHPVDHRSDLYALGASLFQMACGELLFNEKDLSSMVYAHIAQKPRSVLQQKPDWPEVVDDILEYLLEKNPSRRYQNASDALADLLALQTATTAGVELKPTDLIGQNNAAAPRLSGQIFGRDNEKALLFEAYANAEADTSVLSICGSSGVGKTALIRELFQDISRGNGFYIAGKFDQLNKGHTHTAFTEAFAELVKQCLLDDHSMWQSRLRRIVGDDVKLLLEMVPEFSVFFEGVSKDDKQEQRDAGFQRDRLISNLFEDVCECLSSSGRQLVMFIDDLQWADSSSLELLTQVLKRRPKGLLLLLSYRDKEILDNYHANLFVEALVDKVRQYKQIELQALNGQQLQQWLSSEFNQLEKENDLVQQVLMRTGGNPFYIKSLLEKILTDKILYLEGTATKIDWPALVNLPVLSSQDYLKQRIDELHEVERDNLVALSVLGNKCSIDHICDLFDVSRDKLATLIKPLLDKNLLLKSGENIFYAHDSVQQAAASLLSEERSSTLCILMAENLEKKYADQGPSGLSHYLHFYNRARDKITDKEKIILLIRNNIDYSKFLMGQAAYAAAEETLLVAEDLLDGYSDGAYSATRSEIKVNQGSVYISLRQEAKGLECLKWVIDKAPSERDKIEAYSLQLNYLFTAHFNIEAAVVLEKLLLAMDLGFPRKPTKIQQLWSILKVFRYKEVRNPKLFTELPEMQDLEVERQMGILTFCLSSAYMCESDYYPIIMMHMLELTLKHGVSKSTPIVLMGSTLVFLAMKNWDKVESFSSAAFELLKLYPSKFGEIFVHHVYGAMICHWFKPLSENDQYIASAIAKAEESGNFEMVVLNTIVRQGQEFLQGIPLPELLQMQESRLNYLKHYERDLSIFATECATQLFHTLQDSQCDGRIISGEWFDEADMPQVIEEHGEGLWISGFFCDKAYINLINRDFELALENMMRIMDSSLIRAVGVCYHPHIFMTAALIGIECMAISHQAAKAQALVKRSISELKSFSKQMPENYHGRYLIVLARWSEHKKGFNAAMRAYQTATDMASKNESVQSRAALAEMFGRFLLKHGYYSLASHQLGIAYEYYQTWGANPKMNALKEEFGFLRQNNGQLEGSITESTVGDVNTSLDLQSLTKSIELLSRSLDRKELLAGLMEALLLNSGASRVAFLTYENSSLQIIATQEGKDSCNFYDEEDELEDLEVPAELLLDASQNGGQEVLSGEDELSACVLPLKRQGRLLGLLYLENRFLKNTFRPDRLPLLRLLSGQAAIALENSRVFSEVEREKESVKTIIDNVPMMVFGLGQNADIHYVNPEACRISEFDERELLNSNWWQLLHAGQNEKLRKEQALMVASGSMRNYQYSFKTKTGKEKIILWTAVLKGDKRTSKEILLFGVDSTEEAKAKQNIINFNEKLKSRVAERTHELQESLDHLEKTQDKLVKAEKSAALSGLVAGVAHEINTPIGIGVTGITQFLNNTNHIVSQYESGKMNQGNLEQYFKSSQKIAELTHNNLQRAAELVRSFKQISVDQTAEKRRKFHVKEYLQETLVSLNSQHSHRPIAVHIKGGDHIEIDSYPGFYSQILTNLLMNSLTHAFSDDDKGEISVALAADDSTLYLDYRDNGKGIHKDNIKRIFDPFFTTNNLGGGTGLGLNILYNLVTENLNGEVECSSAQGEGVHFSLRLPRNLPKEDIIRKAKEASDTI